MTAILHFGREVECFPFLRSRGYTIDFFQHSIDFRAIRKSAVEYDLVSLAEAASERLLGAATEARERLLVPAILFRTSIEGAEAGSASRGSDYDMEFLPDEPAGIWISELDDLVARGRRLRRATKRIVARSVELREASARVIEKTRLEIERAKQLSDSNEMMKPIANMLADRLLACRRCGESFVFTAGEQLLFQLRGAERMPERCGRCRLEPAIG
ncbi:zinc-ribbon domain containing protein [Occallatibacter savannae]|uniref:zinc-ribbon domain containing protein n=1 Tax=Occallatibacter savannae TaxID=1002691 RepID=UPI000D69004D|nr:zinc-ribbon domain containing protein [Occallatibacter savannae]